MREYGYRCKECQQELTSLGAPLPEGTTHCMLTADKTCTGLLVRAWNEVAVAPGFRPSKHSSTDALMFKHL